MPEIKHFLTPFIFQSGKLSRDVCIFPVVHEVPALSANIYLLVALCFTEDTSERCFGEISLFFKEI